MISYSDEHGVIGIGRLANVAIPKEVRTFVALGPLQVKAMENKRHPITLWDVTAR